MSFTKERNLARIQQCDKVYRVNVESQKDSLIGGYAVREGRVVAGLTVMA